MGRVELGRTQTRWVADSSRLIDYVVTTGDGYAGIMERYADLTGHAPVLPKWAAGFLAMQVALQDGGRTPRRGPRTQTARLAHVCHRHRLFNWSKMGDWKFDPACWPDPSAMVRELAALGIKVMVSIWPTVNPDSENFVELERRNLLIRTERGLNSFIKFTDSNANHTVISGLLDTTHPEARKFLWSKVRENYFRHGIKIWWLDAIEPEMVAYDHDNVRYPRRQRPGSRLHLSHDAATGFS